MSEVWAAIDVGSYEISMKIFELGGKRGVRELDNVRYRIDLGSESYATGRLGASHVNDICRILGEFRKVMKSWGVEKFRACGTSALRESRNCGIVLEQIEKRTGIGIEILSNSEQRYLDYKAVALKCEEFETMIDEPTAIVDIGGGSLQISLFDRDKLISTQNLRLGVLRLKERAETLGIGAGRYDAVISELAGAQLSVFARMYLGDREIKNIIIVDDYISPLLQKPKLLEQSGFVKGGEMDRKGVINAEQFIRFIEEVPDTPRMKSAEKLGIPYENLPLVYISGLLIKCMATTMHAQTLWAPGVTLCDGIGYEYAEKRKVLPRHHDFEQDIIAGAYNISSRYKGNRKRSELIGELALQIFDCMKKIHGLGKRERLLLQIAAILHDCGKYISMMNLGESSFSIIMATEMIGLSHSERMIVAGAVRYIYMPVPDVEPDGKGFVLPEGRIRMTVLKLAAILRVASGLDRTHLKKFKKSTFSLKDDRLVITVDTPEDITVEAGLFGSRAEFFEDIYGITPVIRRKGLK